MSLKLYSYIKCQAALGSFSSGMKKPDIFFSFNLHIILPLSCLIDLCALFEGPVFWTYTACSQSHSSSLCEAFVKEVG